jgi:subtilase family serine protease
MRISKIAVRRAAKVNTGNYENTDVEVSLEATLDVGESATTAYYQLTATADALVREKVDEIELGKRKVASKAGRFGI